MFKAKILNSTISRIKTKKWLIAGVLAMFALALIAWFFGPESAQAQAAANQLSDTTIYKNVTRIVLLLQSFMNKLLWPILFMIGGLLENDLIFNYGMETRLLLIWTQIRNIVNILFVLVLVGVALYNVIGIGGEGDQFSLKSVLPKLLVAIIAVNLSFPVVKLMLDGVNALTVAVFALPESVEEGLGKLNTDGVTELRICKSLYGSDKEKFATKVTEAYNKALKDKKIPANMKEPEFIEKGYFCDKDFKYTKTFAKLFEKYGTNNAALVMAVHMAKVAFVDQALIESKSSFSELTINTLFSLLLYFVYVASFLALFIVLIARLVILWISVALSPFLILSFALPGGVKESLGFLGKLQEYFMKHAFAPVAIGFPMTIGFIMLKAYQGIDFNNSANIDPTGLQTGTVSLGLLTSGISTLQEFIMASATVGVVWFGVFTAAEGTIAQAVTDKLKQATSTVGKFIGTAPLRYLPWVPVGQGEGEEYVPPAAVFEAASDYLHNIRTGNRQKAAKALNLGNVSGSLSDIQSANNVKELEQAIFKNKNKFEQGDPEFIKAAQKSAHYKDLTNNYKEYLHRQLRPPTKANAAHNGRVWRNLFEKNSSFGSGAAAAGAAGAGAMTHTELSDLVAKSETNGLKSIRNHLTAEQQAVLKKIEDANALPEETPEQKRAKQNKLAEIAKDKDNQKHIAAIQKQRHHVGSGADEARIHAQGATGAAGDKATKDLGKELEKIVAGLKKDGASVALQKAAVADVLAGVNSQVITSLRTNNSKLKDVLPAGPANPAPPAPPNPNPADGGGGGGENPQQ